MRLFSSAQTQAPAARGGSVRFVETAHHRCGRERKRLIQVSEVAHASTDSAATASDGSRGAKKRLAACWSTFQRPCQSIDGGEATGQRSFSCQYSAPMHHGCRAVAVVLDRGAEMAMACLIWETQQKASKSLGMRILRGPWCW